MKKVKTGTRKLYEKGMALAYVGITGALIIPFILVRGDFFTLATISAAIGLFNIIVGTIVTTYAEWLKMEGLEGDKNNDKF